jgi:hypothetical protein
MRIMQAGVSDEKSTCALAEPLHDPGIVCAAKKGVDPVKGVGGTAASALFGRFCPFINHGQGQTELSGDLFGAALLEDFPQKFIGLHSATMTRLAGIGKWPLSPLALFLLLGKHTEQLWLGRALWNCSAASDD